MLKPIMSFQILSTNKASNFKTTLFFPILISLVLVLSHGSITAADTTKIGAIIDVSSRIGKEQKVAMEIAAQNFNNASTKHKLALYFQNPGRGALQAAYAAEELIKEKQVQVLVGMETWHEAALIAEIGNKTQVPVLSFTAAATTPPLASIRWPYLVQIATNASEQVNCIASILSSYKWKRVVAIYEDDVSGSDSGILALLSEALQNSHVEIEHRLIFPPFSSMSHPEAFVHKEVTKLLQKQSRVFVVLQSSLSLATHLFREAKELGLVGKDSVWIITETVSSLLDSVNTSVISSMQGALGIDQAYFPDKSKSFVDFKDKFQRIFRVEYPEEENFYPGIYALRAYDSIITIAQAVQGLKRLNRTQEMLIDNILSSNFTGLSGDISFHEGQLSQIPTFRIVNVIGKKYSELGFWSSKFGFMEESGDGDGSESMEGWSNSVNWPGKLRDVPRGWAMPSLLTPMRIVVPGDTSFEKFVKVKWPGTSNDNFSGFCIDVFREAIKVLEKSYSLPYTFYPVNDSYDAFVESVINKTYEAVVGDLTILANRSKYVEFTQPFVESGLSMVVPAKSDEAKTFKFMKPFTKEMWTATGLVMIYTMLIVWVLEHQTNPEFRGPWKDQLSTALWFTFSSLFFAQREKIQSNYTKVVVVVWLFVVFVVTSSYTASLTSMLTLSRMQPTETDIELLRRSNAKVGCDGDSFVKDYLRNVLGFKEENIMDVGKQENYPEKFKSGNITAAFLELPYEKLLLEEHCDEYTATGPVYRFGGFGFAFQKGSPLARDFSEAILTILENGVLKDLEDKWFKLSPSCSYFNSTTRDANSLDLNRFWGLYLISGATSTLCFLCFLLHLLKKFCDSIRTNPGSMTPSRNSLWSKIVRFTRYFRSGVIRSPVRAPSIARSQVDEWSSAKWELVSPSEILDDHHLKGPRPREVQIPIRTGCFLSLDERPED
ncbi:Glutamate receptor 2.7 like [Actinidia chinensis var. chinensis]|uniref:Glutamate receptor n=1 Tax=Actinidia chinensis var. chinensis TaxID=1590841 RepID=A0A2R6PXY3_ACTCC|nr:Glutamate receptor 2.7 like [Actinidia chinensis var. chinensis]